MSKLLEFTKEMGYKKDNLDRNGGLFTEGNQYTAGGSHSRQISDDATPEFGKDGTGDQIGSVKSPLPNISDMKMRKTLTSGNKYNKKNVYDESSMGEIPK